MGIQGLTKLLSDEAPNCMKEVDLDSLTGRKVAVDASMAMYQFLVSKIETEEAIDCTKLMFFTPPGDSLHEMWIHENDENLSGVGTTRLEISRPPYCNWGSSSTLDYCSNLNI